MILYLAIAGFGLAGVFSRFFIESLILPGNVFPFATLAINIVGSFVMGWIYGWHDSHRMFSPEVVTGIMVGFLGGFTTYSGYALQTLKLAQSGQTFLATTNFLLTPAFCLLSAWIGCKLAP